MFLGKRMKRLSLLLVLTLITASLPVLPAEALAESDLKAPAAVLMDTDTGTVLFEKNIHEVRACASITKVMTLLLVMEAIEEGRLHWEDTVTTSAHAASMGGSDIWLEPGETMSVEEMVKATIVASANDAAVALAETISGTEDAFVAAMNRKAQSLHMKETVFKNCNGLDEEGHVTSAYDVAVMSRELLKHPSILTYSGIWMDELRDGKTQLVNTNKLLKSYDGITGLKTGTTSQAGSCISATAERDGLSLVAVVLGCPTGKDRFSDASALLDFGFAHYTLVTPEVPAEALRALPVKNGMMSSVGTTCRIQDRILVEKGKGDAMRPTVYLPEVIEAPVEEGEVIGKVVYGNENGGDRIAEYPIAASSSVPAVNFNDVMGLFLRCLAG